MQINFLNLKTMKTIKSYAMTALAIGMLASCSSDDDGGSAVEEEEAITLLTLTYVNESNPTDIVVLNWNDNNGDEVVDENEKTTTGVFSANQNYKATLQLFNQEEDFLDEDITSSQAGIDAHFFVYNTDLDFTMTRDADDFERTDGNKLGVITDWTAGATASEGYISVSLYHESPSVDASNGFGTAAGDDTDIDISFDVAIQ